MDPRELEVTVIAALCAACRVEPEAVTRSTALLALELDSLTLVAALSRIEAALDISFETSEIAETLCARDVGELIGTIARKL